MKKEKKNKKNKYIILVIIFFIVLLALIFGAKIFLYFRVLTGNDLVIKLSADNENIFLKHGESGKIKITSVAISNVFCTANCTTKFIDLSTGQTLEQDNFNLKLPKTKEFTITAKDSGVGQELYRFDLECDSEKSFLCATTGMPKKRTLLLTMNYEPSDEEKSIKQNISQNLSFYLGEINYDGLNLFGFEKVINRLNNTLEADDLMNRINKTKNLLSISNLSSSRMITLWNNQDYFSLDNEFPSFKNSMIETENGFYEINDSINSNITFYNSLIDNLTEIKDNLKDLQKLNLSENSSERIDNMTWEYNNLTVVFQGKDLLSNKEISINNLLNETSSFIPELSNSSHPIISPNNITFSKIILNDINFTNYNLPISYKKCCYDNKCDKCCDDNCYNEPGKYPIIFLHGHSFNQAVSAEESLDSFEEIQRDLENDSYINAGSLYLSSSKTNNTGIWGNINYPLTIKASYYFDLLTNNGEDVIIQTKTDNLDTYTLRLREIINEVKLKTNRQKVTIVAHSMGGLIARRYIQVFGVEDIDKMIFIDVPNHGLTGKAVSICPIFGTKLECDDMNENSLFMNKLDNAPEPNIPIYNIIGIGCQTNSETGDGVVTNSSQYLSYANNYYLNGTCKESEFTYLHTEIINPKEYPEILGLIRNALNDSDNTIQPTKSL